MTGFLEAVDSEAGKFALGSVGNAINAIEATRNAKRMYRLQTAQLKEQIAYQRKIMEEQIALREQERIRQQMLARAGGDAFASSMGQYQDFEDRIGSRSNDIAGTFQQALARQTPDISPQAQGPVADRIASATQLANERSSADANALANVQGLGRALSDSGMAANRNNQVASMLRNFSSGSAGASDAEVESRAGRLFQPRYIQPAPSMLGDLFVGLSGLGIQSLNRPPAPASPYEFDVSGLSQNGLRYDTGGVGIRTDRPSGIGLRANGVRTVGG
jgi:hypothetical protein